MLISCNSVSMSEKNSFYVGEFARYPEIVITANLVI